MRLRGSGPSAEVKVLGGYTEASLEEILRSVCSGQPLSLFSLPEHLDLANTTDNHHQLLSFLKQHSNIFHISSSPFGHMVSLVDENLRYVEDLADACKEHVETADPSISTQGNHADVGGSDEMGSFLTHLYSVISEAGRSLSLAQLALDEVCVAEFPLEADLEQYLCQQPQFAVRDSEAGKMVSLQSSIGPKVGASAASVSSCGSVGSRWGRARNAERAEALPVTPEHVKIEEGQRSANPFQEHRFTDCEATFGESSPLWKETQLTLLDLFY